MVNLYVLAVLEHIFGVALQSVDEDVLTEHEGVGAVVQLDILDANAVDTPECLIGIIDDDILQFQVLHLTEELRTVDDTVLHLHVIAVPDSRTASRCKIAVGDDASVNVPPRVFPVKLAVVSLYVFALFDARFPIRDGDSFEP